MPKISADEYLRRRDQIIDACAALYEREGYAAITVAAIADRVTFGRANIYNYFANKDEIALALLAHEHDLWASDLAVLASTVAGEPDELVASALARGLENRHTMLRLLALSLSTMEQNARPEQLAAFKASYRKASEALRMLLEAIRPAWDDRARDDFTYAFLPFLHGVYPYAHHTRAQLEAMEKAGIADPGRSVSDLVRTLVLSLLSGIDARLR